MKFELFGLPGSGKSYCCDIISKKKIAKNIMNYYKENFFGKVIFHLFLKFFILNIKLRKKYKEVIEILGETSNYINLVNPNVKIELYIKYMIFIYFIENLYKINIIIDEGIIHYCMVLYAEFSVEKNKINKIISAFNIEDKNIIGLNCEKEIAIKQMKKRNRKRTAIDFLGKDELSNILDRYLEIYNYFSKRFECLDIKEVENFIIRRNNNEV